MIVLTSIHYLQYQSTSSFCLNLVFTVGRISSTVLVTSNAVMQVAKLELFNAATWNFGDDKIVKDLSIIFCAAGVVALRYYLHYPCQG